MKIKKLVITIDNFENDDMLGYSNEVIARTLHELAKRFKGGFEPTKVLDTNGQSVGKVEYY